MRISLGIGLSNQTYGGMTMYVENIICDIEDLIFDVKAAGCRAYDNRKDADRVFTQSDFDVCQAVFDGLICASNALDNAKEDFQSIEERLRKIIEGIQMEALSAQARGRAISEATKVQGK